MLILSITGCSEPEPMTFEEIYPGNLSDVSKIEIRHGNGGLKEITDKTIINPWLENIKVIIFEPLPNKDRQVGYLYSVKLFEGEELKLSFSSTEINGYYYKQNELILKKLHSLFNEN